MSAPARAPDEGVTVVVRRRVRPDAVEDFEQWLAGILAATARAKGHLGSNVARPSPGGNQDYVVIFRFDSDENLTAWQQSPERNAWLDKVAPFTVGAVEIERVTGLEYWFTLPEQAARRPPPAWKMAIVTLTGLLPLVHWVAPWIHAHLPEMPPLLATLIAVGVLVVLMTWAVMPALIRLARPWLFPEPRDRGL